MQRYLTIISACFYFLTCYGQEATSLSDFNHTTFPSTGSEITPEMQTQADRADKQHPQFGQLPDDAPCTGCFELPGKRTASSRYFVEKGSQGKSFYVQQSTGALHYQNDQGFWMDIDFALQPAGTNAPNFIASHQPIPTRLNKATLTNGLKVNGEWIEFGKSIRIQWMGAGDTTIFSAQDFTQKSIGAEGLQATLPGKLTMEHRVQRGAIKTNYLLPAVNSVPANAQWLQIRENIALPEGYYLAEKSGQMEEDRWVGSIGIFNDADALVATIEAPYIYDAAQQSMPAGFGYSFAKMANGQYQLTLEVKANWLQAVGRQFPVTIDPLKQGVDSNANTIGFEPSNFCFDPNDYCPTPLTVTVPGQSELITAFADVRVSTKNNGCNGACDPSQAAIRIYGPCQNRHVPAQQDSFIVPEFSTQDFQLNLFNNVNCETKSCIDHVLSFTMRTYSCSCPNDPDCGTGCHFINAHDWTITVQARTLEASIAEGDSLAVCAGETISLNANNNFGVTPYNHSWQPGNQTGDEASFVLYSDTIATLAVTDQCGNTVNDSIKLHVKPAPDIEFSNVVPVCQGQSSGEATADVTNMGGPFTYQWSTNPVQTTQTATNLSTGTYYVTVTGSNGCSNVDSVEITQPPNALSISMSKTDVSCNATADGSASVNISGGTQPIDVAWNTGSTSQTLTNIAGGTYSVTVTDGQGCKLIDSVAVLNSGNLSVNLQVDSITCHEDDNGIIVTDVSGSGPFNYEWNNGSTNSSLSGLGGGSYTVTVTDDNGCQAEKTATLIEPDPLQLTTSSQPVTCDVAGKNGKVMVEVQGGTPPYNYQWNTSPVQMTDTADGLGAGSYTVTVTDDNNCTQTKTATVDPPANFNVTFEVDSVSCFGLSDGEITVNVTGGVEPYDYQWNTSGNATSPTVTGLSAGFYTVTITDDADCEISQNVQMPQPPEIGADLIASNVSCPGAMDGEATVLPKGGQPPYDVLWSTGPADTLANNDSLGIGDYEVYITDSEQCMDTVTITINGPDTVDYSYTTQDASCQGIADGEIALTYSGGRPPLLVEWTTPLPDADTVRNLEAGSYSFTITTGDGCQVSDTVTIENATEIALSATVTHASCSGKKDGALSVSASNGSSPYSYLWQDSTTGPALNDLAPGQYSVTATAANGCEADTTLSIIAEDSISVVLPPDTTISLGSTLSIVPVVEPPGAYDYQWQPVDNLDDSTGSTQTIQPRYTQTYTLQVTNTEGCSATDSMLVEVMGEPRISLPNAFSPNQDGVNDLFFDLPTVAIQSITIFDRWGKVVYQGSEPWDGSYPDGQPAPVGQYVFQGTVRANGSNTFLQVDGSIMLIR